MRPRLLDLFCGAGGASAGYSAAGYEVTGVDVSTKTLTRYPFDSVRADALESCSSDWLWSVYESLAESKPLTVDVAPEVFRRMLELLAVPSIVAELRRRDEVAELEGGE